MIIVTEDHNSVLFALLAMCYREKKNKCVIDKLTRHTQSVYYVYYLICFAGSIDCTLCPKGYACPNVDSGYEQPCALGTYSTGEQTSCTPCPTGYYCPSTVLDTEVPCPGGTYSTGNQSSCTVCPAGWECPDTDSDLNV